MSKGIDVSHWNGDIDFNKVKADGYDFVIIKAGGHEGRFYKDPKFEENYLKAKEAGLFIGAYYFAGKSFRGVEAGLSDARHFLELIKDKKFDYPVFIDIEAQENRYKEAITDAVCSFCSYLETAHYFVGIYASDISGFKDKLNHERIRSYAHWVARYGRAPEICKEFGIWQYSSKGTVSGISGSVDLDNSYIGYEKIIKEKGLNGYEADKANKPKDKKIKIRRSKE